MMNTGRKAPSAEHVPLPSAQTPCSHPKRRSPHYPDPMLTALSHRGILVQKPTASPGSLKGDGHAGKAEDHGWSLGPSKPNTHRAVEQQRGAEGHRCPCSETPNVTAGSESRRLRARRFSQLQKMGRRADFHRSPAVSS